MLERFKQWTARTFGLGKPDGFDAVASGRFRRPRTMGLGQRRFDGAGLGRRLEDWQTGSSSANAEVARGMRLLKERSRDLIRNDGNAIRAKREFQQAMVSTGIRPRCRTGVKTLDRKVDQLWARHAEVINTRAGVRTESAPVAAPNAYGMQHQAAGAWFETGEAILRKRTRLTTDELPVPFQLELLEGDHLDTGVNRELPNGGRVVQGVELGPTGDVRAYYLHRRHPGDSSSISGGSVAGADPSLGGSLGTSSRVPAGEVALLYEEMRPGQLRGIPWLTPVLVNVKDLGDAADAERVRMRVAACAVAFVHSDDLDEEGITAIVEDADGNPLEVLEPGLIAYVRGGKEIKFNNPTAVSGYGEFHKTELTRVGAGVGMDYPRISGDLKGVSFSSIRFGEIGFRRMINAYRVHMFVPLFCAPMWRWFIAHAIAAGELKPRAEGYPCSWVFPPWDETDAVKHATAIKLQMRNGTLSLQRAIEQETGRDWLEVLDEHEAAKEELERRELVFDSTPWAGGSPGKTLHEAQAEETDPAESAKPDELDEDENEPENDDDDDGDGENGKQNDDGTDGE